MVFCVLISKEVKFFFSIVYIVKLQTFMRDVVTALRDNNVLFGVVHITGLNSFSGLNVSVLNISLKLNQSVPTNDGTVSTASQHTTNQKESG